ncbi:DUF6507 family protein [Nocardiopsis sp. NRRL B-16309]|uniref:DUF6507 family protein n=1 Tax=Nocardiopsis sp. NRRL B-16309 TaxID=1519494 RepID=UPI0006B00B8B|nr:DUF6507 family protein [Nocardiopsis sp. NRRL B-16309]
MSAWNIQPGPVGAVLAAVNGHLGDQEGTSGLTGHVRDLGDAVVAASETCADSLPVSIALNGFLEHCSPDCRSMIEKTASAITGCSDATNHYRDGALDMAAEAQANAGVLFDPNDPNDLPPNL